MNKLSKYIIIGVVTAVILFLAWYFSSILTSILIAAVISLIGKPLMNLLLKVKIGKYFISPSIASLITLVTLFSIFMGLIFFFTPLIGRIITEMSSLNFDDINNNIAEPLAKYNSLLHEMFPTMDTSVTIESMVIDKLKEIFNFSLFTNALNSVTSFLVNFFITIFTVLFVTFFFLKDSNTFSNMVMLFVPSKYESNTKRALESVNKLLIRYFTGISVETLLITFLNTIGLYFICGVNFQTAVVLAFLSGVLNVIPYIGPLSAGLFGTIMGVISIYSTGINPVLNILIFKLVLTFTVTHLIDVFIFQPFIYSNSVKAHPLEIFLVILIAGNIGGIVGMLVAIPAYTVIRVFAKEFLYKFEVVQKITDKMEE